MDEEPDGKPSNSGEGMGGLTREEKNAKRVKVACIFVISLSFLGPVLLLLLQLLLMLVFFSEAFKDFE